MIVEERNWISFYIIDSDTEKSINMFDVVGKHSIAAKANRYTTIKGLTEGQLGAEVVKGIIEQIQCVGHLQLHGLVIYTVGPTAEVLLFWKTMPCYDGSGFYSTANLKGYPLTPVPMNS